MLCNKSGIKTVATGHSYKHPFVYEDLCDRQHHGVPNSFFGNKQERTRPHKDIKPQRGSLCILEAAHVKLLRMQENCASSLVWSGRVWSGLVWSLSLSLSLSVSGLSLSGFSVWSLSFLLATQHSPQSKQPHNVDSPCP